MSEKDTGGPAFPVSTRPMEEEVGFGHQDSNSTWQFGGMTLRDYFAAKAMQAWVSTSPKIGETQLQMNNEEHAKLICEHAYDWADVMLEARK